LPPESRNLASLLRNISYVALSQSVGNYLIPLITIPYITRVVGPGNYGIIEWIATLMVYFIVLVDYSFDSTAARKLAACKPDDHQAISTIFSTVIGAKALLFGGSLLVFVCCILLVPQMAALAMYLWLAFPIVLGWVLFPQFLFVGRQKLGFSAAANLFIKLLAAVLFFVLVKNPNDYYLVPTINGFAQLLAGAIMFAASFKLFKNLRFLWPTAQQIFSSIREGFYVFMSNLFNRIQGMNALLIGGFVLLAADLGYFAAAFKLLIVAQSLVFFPLYGALFPYLSAKAAEDKDAYLRELRRIAKILIAVTAALTLVIILFAGFAVKLLFGEQFQESVLLLQILAPSLLASAFLHIYHFQGLQVLHQDDAYFRVVLVGGIVSIVLNIILMHQYGGLGAAWARVGVEAMMAFLAYYLFKKRIKKLGYA